MAIATSTLAIIGTAVAVIGAGVSTYSAVEQSAAAEKAAGYNAAVQRNAAATAHAEATAEAIRSRDRSRRLIASQRAQFAKSGGSLSGSALDALYDTSVQAEADAMSIEYRGAVSAGTSSSMSKLYSMQAANAKNSRGPMIAGTVLGGLGQATGTYMSGRGN